MHAMGRIRQAFSRWRRSSPSAGGSGAPGRDDVGCSASEHADLRAELVETAHERDVSMARASAAEERARLARERLESLASLEHRVEVAERRALDAERRLEEIGDRVNGSGEHGDTPDEAVEPPGGTTAELRARLARAAARKRPHTRNPLE